MPSLSGSATRRTPSSKTTTAIVSISRTETRGLWNNVCWVCLSIPPSRCLAHPHATDLGFPPANITLLIDDDSVNGDRWPSYSNMVQHLSNFVDPTRPNARYVVCYAGHSKQIPSPHGFLFEKDGKDECMYQVYAFPPILFTPLDIMPCVEKHATVYNETEQHIPDDVWMRRSHFQGYQSHILNDL